jgi:hypothetical protein
MNECKIGDRVGAIESGDKSQVSLYGFGTYQGKKVPTKEISELFYAYNVTNLCILLDSGKEVYGFECWWGSEKRVEEILRGKEIVNDDIDETRALSKSRTQAGGKEETHE